MAGAAGRPVAAGLKESGVAACAVAGIAVAGQQHGLVVLDRAGTSARARRCCGTTPAPRRRPPPSPRHWAGPRPGPRRTGSVPVASLTASKWQWLRASTNRRTPPAAAAVRLPHDFLTERLAGAAVTDPGDASGTGWYSTATGAYAHPELPLELLGLDAALLPEVAETGATRRRLAITDAAADALGLPAPRNRRGRGNRGQHERRRRPRTGRRRTAGPPRAQPRHLGNGLRLPPRPPDPAPRRRRCPASPRRTVRYLPLACTLNCHARRGQGRRTARPGPRRRGAPAAEAVLLPYLDGERTPDLPNASGLLTGLRHDTTPQQLLGAAYEGAVEALLTGLDVLEEQTGPLDAQAPLVLVGGGARGAAWRATAGRLSGRALQIPDETDAVALGAAALAAAALGLGDAPAIARGWDTRRGVHVEAVERDDERLARIRRVREQLAELNAGA